MFAALSYGMWRVIGSPRMLVLLWAVNLVAALPAAWAVTSAIHASVEHSVVHERLRDDFDMGWQGEFHDRARGAETTFRPDVTGAGAFYANLEMWITGRLLELPPEVLGLAAVYLLTWILLQGGVVARLVRPGERFRASGFLGTGARFFFRYVQLTVLSGAVYFLLFLASRRAYERVAEATRDVPAERPVLLLSLGVLAVTAVALAAVQASFAYARITTVVEDRRNMLLTALEGARIFLSRPLRTVALYGMLGLVSAVLLLLYGWIAPVAGPSSLGGVAMAFLAAQAYLMLKLALRLSLLGGLVALHPSAGSPSGVAHPMSATA